MRTLLVLAGLPAAPPAPTQAPKMPAPVARPAPAYRLETIAAGVALPAARRPFGAAGTVLRLPGRARSW